MAEKIKGIVIEFGGDTKKLNKAIDDVEKKGKSLQTELKQIDKLLKLDPTNTELLSQRQELLAKSVEQTTQKLNALRASQDQMQRANAANADWEAAYAPLGAAIDDTQTKLRALLQQDAVMKKQLSDGNISAEEYAAFSRTLDETQATAKALQAQKKDLDAQFSDGHISDKEYRKFQRELISTQTEVNNLSQKLQSSQSALTDFAKHAENAGEKTGDLAKSFAPVSAAAGVALASIAKLGFSAAASADDINTLSKQTGLSTDQIQKFMYAADTIDVPLDTLTGSMAKLTRNMESARDGSGAAADAFYKLYINVTDVHGNLRSNQDVFNQAIDQLGRISNSTERDALAMQLFGKSAQDLNPLILGGADALEELGKAAENNGLIMTPEELDRANATQDAYDEMKATVAGVARSIGTDIGEMMLPILQSLTQLVLGAADAFNGMSDSTKKWIVTILLIVASLAPVLFIISSIFKTISNISNGIKGLSDIAGIFASGAGNKTYLMFVKWAAIIIAVVAAVALLITAINILMGKGDQVNQSFSGMGNVMDGGQNAGQRSIPGYASGTDYHPGGLAMVGEAGAELVALPRGAKVYNNRQTRGMLDAGIPAGGDTFYITVGVDHLDDMQQVVTMAKEARRMERMGKVTT